MEKSKSISNLLKALTLSAGLLAGANNHVNAQPLNNLNYSSPEQSSQNSSISKEEGIEKDYLREAENSKNPEEGKKRFIDKNFIERIPGLYLTIDPIMSLDKNGYSGAGLKAGILYNINDLIGIGANISFEGLNDKIIESYTGELSPTTNRYSRGSKKDVNRKDIGIDGEFGLGPVFIGGGISMESGIETTLEEIVKKIGDAEEILRSNNSAINYSINSINGYIGLNASITEDLTARILLGYKNKADDKNGFYFGGGISIKLMGKNPYKDSKENYYSTDDLIKEDDKNEY